MCNEAGFMRRAIELSAEGMAKGAGGPFGAVVVKAGKIIAEGWNEVTSSNDPTAHAEVLAIRRAAKALGTFDLSGCDVYASCEPCPMCLSAIYWSRASRLFYGAHAADAAAADFDDAFLYEQMKLPESERSLPTKCLMSDEAAKVFHAWLEKPDRVPY